MTNPLAELPEMVAKMRKAHPPKTEAEMRDYLWQTDVRDHLIASGIPPRFHYELKTWNRRQKNVFNQCRELCHKTGAIVAMIGDRGRGKTTIAAQLVIERAWNEKLLPWHRRPPYRKMSQLVSKFKSLYSDYGSIDTEYLMGRRDDLCRDHPLLIIDELHECDDQRMKDRVLTDILDRRYANLVDTILISNQTPEEFQAATNDSALSRLAEHGRIIVCNWESFRTQ